METKKVKKKLVNIPYFIVLSHKSAFFRSGKIKRDEQLLCVFPASPFLPSPLWASSLCKEGVRKSDKACRESTLEVVWRSLLFTPDWATKQPHRLGRPIPLGPHSSHLGNGSSNPESETFCASTQSAKRLGHHRSSTWTKGHAEDFTLAEWLILNVCW